MVSYLSHDYDVEVTETLIQLFRTCAAYPLVIFFNDRRIPGTHPLAEHGSYTTSVIHYLIYSNDLDEAQPPTSTDQRLAVAVGGDLAKQVFDSIGPDLKLACGTTLGMRQRQRGDVDCSYDKDQPASPYSCHFGIDLRKGKSIAGATC